MTPFFEALGWSEQFLAQMSDSDIETLTPVRLTEVRRNRVIGLDAQNERVDLALSGDNVATDMAVGDFVLSDGQRLVRVLSRKSVISRKAAGHTSQAQLIAANIDTLFIVTSCNADFNEARLERYVALAIEAETNPVIVMTKADMSLGDPQSYIDRAHAISDRVTALALNSKDPNDVAKLNEWCGPGQTVALVGSSGVGKSTIGRTLTGEDLLTADIREDDAKGRHTTTARSMHLMHAGGWMIDTPGMRELALHDAAAGIATLFEDITDLITECKFSDCQHKTEPGCAILAAIDAGTLSHDRLNRWQKLRDEDATNTGTIATAKERGRKFSKVKRTAFKAKRVRRGEIE
ncbi:ribosome small subunit-dependent GTPase A [Pacificibacter marinus]|uniref:Small ribosomal subunit biogenesis GTPase RsgA n=1 Tax=Pacificibacter marinus TaxID=658057 RepID=A0A1Y5S738_9RHOB|nr:ribosome small subunit-dependent GTPase A [Pacificibacter marinus]SEK77811.1 ribosome biogenesis GTPase [Pacificibacter marinus]SLN33972.1 Putative ribosome biogenesis GTPase RsgA [Pacificibacter marinus]